jgi:ATP-binding cassette subfamily B protein
LEYVLWILSWVLVGRGALEGRLDPGWLLAWALILLTIVPFHLLVTWSEGVFAIGAGGLLKQRLLFGALRLDPQEIRHQGAGQLMGRVIESEAVESLALGGGILGFLASVELVLAALVLAAGAAGVLQPILLVLWVGLTLFCSRAYTQRRRAWTNARLGMTHGLIERLVGHRTRLAQEAPEHWHEPEDQELEQYLELSRSMDRAGVALMAFLPRGWLLLGLCGMAPSFVSGAASPARLAVSLGGILLAYRALQRLVQGLSRLAGAGIAWRQVEQLFLAAARNEGVGALASVAAHAPTTDGSGPAQPVLQAHDVVFRYPGRVERVLHGCSLDIRRGDRLLVEGPSGGGKSTLASLFSGLRIAEGGLLLLGGLDRQTLGAAAWRRRVAAAPQFHDNHVLTETFAFNLLMGRRWPATSEDLEEAEAVCQELGLGDLLGSMPSGMLQMVGESGWQLSHGERSRLFIARALLQHADLVVLDESFASLDPETMQRALHCVLRRAPTLLVVAHP